MVAPGAPPARAHTVSTGDAAAAAATAAAAAAAAGTWRGRRCRAGGALQQLGVLLLQLRQQLLLCLGAHLSLAARSVVHRPQLCELRHAEPLNGVARARAHRLLRAELPLRDHAQPRRDDGTDRDRKISERRGIDLCWRGGIAIGAPIQSLHKIRQDRWHTRSVRNATSLRDTYRKLDPTER